VVGSDPLLSLVIPVRGDARELQQLQVIDGAVLPGVEWIIVIDGDPVDAVASVLAAVSDRSDVTVVLQERRGPGAARNAGLVRAAGAVVAFVDSDDVADVDAFARLAAAMTAGGARIGVLGYSVVRTDPDIEELERHVPAPGLQEPWSLLRRRAAVWRFAFDRDFLLGGNIRFPDQGYAEDLIFLTRALASGERAWGLPRCGYTYRLHSDSPLTQRSVAPGEVTATLGAINEALSSCRSPEQKRVLESWQARIWLRNRCSADGRRMHPLGPVDVVKGLGWSIAWACASPRDVASFVRIKAVQRASRGPR
jgi:hypothetical protein